MPASAQIYIGTTAFPAQSSLGTLKQRENPNTQIERHPKRKRRAGKKKIPMDHHQSPRPLSTVRRNPPRRAKQTPAANAPDFSTSSSSTAAAGITPFPLEELLEADPEPDPQPKPKPPKKLADGSDNLNVFLRIRPLEIRPNPAKNLKAKPRGKAQPPSPKQKRCKSNKECLVVNDSSSVTLSAPPSVFDSKRSKSEVYDGFSFVFPPDSAQVKIDYLAL